MSESAPSILIIEDNEMSLAIACAVLEGHAIETAKTVDEGLQKFRTMKPDITFLDIALPDGSGLDMLLDLKKDNPQAFIIMITASRLTQDMVQARENGAQGYILKPFSAKRVKECIAQYHTYRQKVSG